MYRIRSASGTEAVYNSLEEFTAAVRRGEVVPEDEIFHSRANRWLDIKSHPHYRSAINWSGPLSAEAIFAPPPAAAPPAPRPAPPAPAASAHNAPHPKPQVSEIPAPSRPATVARPQLAADAPPKPQPSPAAQPPHSRPPAKTSELTFVEVDPPAPRPPQPAPQRQNVTVVQVPKPPVAATPPAAPPPATAKPKAPDFLVMDTGLEHPVRTSNGHRTITGDADMLFDVPLAEPLPPSQAVTVGAPTPPASPPARATPPAAPPQHVESAIPPHRAPTPAADPVPARVSAPVVAPAPSLDIPGPALLDSEPLRTIHVSRPRRAPRTGLAIGAGLAVIIAGGALLVFHPWRGSAPSTTDFRKEVAPTQVQGLPPFVGNAETTATVAAAINPGTPIHSPTVGVTQADSARPAPSDEVIAARPNLQPDLPAPVGDLNLASDLGTGATTATAAVTSPADLAKHLDAAERQARQDLAARLGLFRAVLSAQRLSGPDGVAQARSAWTTGADAIRQYRARIARLERAYEDSVLASQRTSHWSPDEMRPWASHESLAEPGETSQMADLMLSQVSEGLGILVSLNGSYEIQGGKIKFLNPTDASRYVSIRAWVEQRTQAWTATPEGARPYTIGLILRALGDGFPPVE
jgi:hypothetical protein